MSRTAMRVDAGPVRHEDERGSLFLDRRYSAEEIDLLWQILDETGLSPSVVRSMIATEGAIILETTRRLVDVPLRATDGE